METMGQLQANGMAVPNQQGRAKESYWACAYTEDSKVRSAHNFRQSANSVRKLTFACTHRLVLIRSRFTSLHSISRLEMLADRPPYPTKMELSCLDASVLIACSDFDADGPSNRHRKSHPSEMLRRLLSKRTISNSGSCRAIKSWGDTF